MLNLLILLALAGIMAAAGTFAPASSPVEPLGQASLAAGFMLLAAYFSGKLFAGIRLPKLTGYIAAGIVFGPSVLGLVTSKMVADLTLVNGVAVALIALTAGGEMAFGAIRPLLRVILWISVIAVLGTGALLAAAVFALRGYLPFFAELPLVPSLAVAGLLAVTIVAQSPAVVVALRDETAAEGPVSQTVLGVVVIADLLVIVLFALATSVAQAVLGTATSVGATAAKVAWELFGSLGAGVVVGAILALYLRLVKGGASLFLLAVAVIIAEIGTRVHLDPLLIALAAGMLVNNATSAGHRLLRDLEASSMPVYVLFFAVAGAAIHLDVLPLVWVPALALIAVRAAGFLAGTQLACVIAGASRPVRTWAGFGLLPQAGLALALAMLVARTFPILGETAAALILGIVAINEIVAPALFRVALVRSGEAGKRVTRADSLHEGAEEELVAPRQEAMAPKKAGTPGPRTADMSDAGWGFEDEDSD